MTWAFLDDRADDNPKLLAVGAEAAWYWACGLCYCRRNPKVPGFVPAQKALVLFPVSNARRTIRLLVDAGLWHEVAGGYEVHDYAQIYNATPETQTEADAEALRAKRAEAGRLGGLRSTLARRAKHGTAQPNPKQSAEANPEANPKQSDSKQTGDDSEQSGSKQGPKQRARTGHASRAPGSARDARALGSDSDSGSDLIGSSAAADVDPRSEASPKQQQQHDQRVSCPMDLALTGDQRKTLVSSLIPEWAIDAVTVRFVAKAIADPGDCRRLSDWRKSLAAAIAGDWNDPKRRPKDPRNFSDSEVEAWRE